MNWNLIFLANSCLLGVGLAMDAFSVSIVNALSEPGMRRRRQCAIAGVYALFQFLMPLAGWICVRTIASIFTSFQKFIPWIALILLLYIGGKMIAESILEGRKSCEKCGKSGGGCADCKNKSQSKKLTFAVLLIQGIATSIDALSVGFTISDYGLLMAVSASLIIAAVTFAICMTGLLIGRKAGEKLSSHAQILGGLILISIGIEIFVRGVFF